MSVFFIVVARPELGGNWKGRLTTNLWWEVVTDGGVAVAPVVFGRK